MRPWAVNRRGFSLVEILVALVVLSVGIYSVADLMASAQRTGAAADGRLQAAALARLKLAEIKASPALAAVVPSAGKHVLIPEKAQPFPQNAGYLWQATLQRDAITSDRVDIRVEVRKSGAGSESAPPLAAAVGFELGSTGHEGAIQ